MSSVTYRGYMIQALRKGERDFVVHILPLNQVHSTANQGERPSGFDQLIKLTNADSGMYLHFSAVTAAMEAGEKKVDAILRLATVAKPENQSRGLW